MKAQAFSDQALEQSVRQIMEQAEANARLSAENESPTTKEEVQFGFRPVHRQLQTAIDSITGRLQLHTIAHTAGKLKERHEAFVVEQRKGIVQAKERLIQMGSGTVAEAHRGLSKAAQWFLIGMMGLLVLSDGLYLSPAFEYMGLSYLASLVMGLAVGGILGVTAHLMPDYVYNGKLPKKHIHRLILFGSAICVFLMALAYVRVNMNPAFTGLSDGAKTMREQMYFLVSMALFIGALLISIRLYKNRKHAVRSPEETAQAKERQALETAIQEAEQKIEEANEKLVAEEAELQAQFEYGSAQIQSVTHKAEQIFDTYTKILHRNRAKNTDPRIFYADYPFDFKVAVQPYVPNEFSNNNTFRSLFLICSLAATLFGCSSQDYTDSVAVSLVTDATEKERVCPDTAGLFRLIGIDQNPWGDYTGYCSHITDKDFPVTGISELPGENRYIGNVYERQKKVQQFKDGLAECCEMLVNEGDGELPHSVVYRTLASELNSLAALPHGRKFLIVHSDLMEKDIVDLYTKKDWRLLTKHPDQLQQIFLDQVQLHDLSGIEIYLVYMPKSHAENTRFQTVSRFFADFFTAHGATVEIRSQL